MARNRLAQLLLDNQTVEPETQVTKVGLEQITNISEYIRTRVHQWDRTRPDYDPLFEIAKLGLMTDNESLQFKCHAELARYQYPQIRSLEIQSKADKEVNIKIELANFAHPAATEIEAEDIEDHDEEHDESQEAEYRYVDSVLKQAEKKPID